MHPALQEAEYRVLSLLPPASRRRWLYARVHRRWPDFRTPTTFSEKINWRILHDRRPRLAWTCDKLQMKAHAEASGADVVVPRTLWVGRDVRELATVDLPEHWVVKPSHRSGLVQFGDASTDLAALAAETESWLAHVQGGALAEWAYSQAEPALFVEELIGEPGAPPPDYKFFTFDGEPRLVQVDTARFTGHRRSLFTPEWEKLDVQLGFPDAGPLPRPHLLPRMLDVARALGAEFEFMRVDLYADGDDVVFGEYTPYPGSGMERFTPRQFDARLGAHWQLPDLSDTAAGARGAA